MVLTTETLEGVATPVTVPPPALLDDDPPPLQPAISKVKAVKPMPSFTIVDSVCLIVMMVFPVCYWYVKNKCVIVTTRESALCLFLLA